MVAGKVSGTESSAVFIVDTANQELMAVTYSQNSKKLDGIGHRNLASDAASVLPARSRPSN